MCYFLAITIDLADEKLLGNNKKLAKLKSRLHNLESFTVLLSWQPPVGDICPSSIAKYLDDLGYMVKECTPTSRMNTVNCEIPELQLNVIDRNDAAEFAEWLGMVSIGGTLQTEPGDYLSSYVAPSYDNKKGLVKCMQWRGFFTTSDVSGLIDEITSSCKSLKQTWMSVYVQGFADCPVSWSNEEQNYFTSGDNGYLIMFNDDGGLICSQKCSRKRYK